MINLCYSTFLHLVQEHYIYDIPAEVLAFDVISQITPATQHSKYTKGYLGFFWDRNRNIPSDVRENIGKEPYKTNCKNHFKDVISVQFNPALEDDFYMKLENLISNDESIPSKKKSSLHNTLVSGDKAKYLFDVFFYAIAKPNKDVVTQIGEDDIDLISEVDHKCPLCSEHTGFFSKSLCRYTVVRIYPEFLEAPLKSSFDSIKPKPSDPDDKVNKICLCDNCASDYLHIPTTAVYDRLLRIKASRLNKPSSSPIATQELDEKIKEILDKLGSVNPTGSEVTSSRIKPLKLINKIPKDSYLLLKEIHDDNDTYFWFIKDHISQIEEYRSSFRRIAAQIHTSYVDLDTLGYSHERIYNDIIDWVLHKIMLPNTYRQAAHIIVSFFVQNCEVFDEISE